MKREQAMELAAKGFEELSEALAAGRSESLIAYLDMMARFHSYSFRNSLLILMQRPSATRVAGFRQWENLGRHVKKGEKGIGIFAPMIYRNKNGTSKAEKDETVAGDEPGKTLRGFRLVHVFDVEQTEGKPLPEFANVEGEPGDWLRKLETVIRDANIELEYVDNLGGPQGLAQSGKISVLTDLPLAEKFCVLTHEHAHLLMHTGTRRKETNKKIRETEAEAVSFVVARAIHLDAKTHASDYIQLYQSDRETLEESIHFIQETSASIIEALNRVGKAEQLDSLVQHGQTVEMQATR